jgi:arylsulfate sulfotransferase
MKSTPQQRQLPICRILLVVGAALAGSHAAGAQLSVTLTTSFPSPQPVGQSLILTATVTNDTNPALRYRFMVQPPGAASFNMLVDYGQSNAVQWSSLQEGAYQIQIQVVDPATGEAGEAVIPFQFSSRITGSTPVVSASSHPLVAIYSAPPCAAGNIQVLYRPTNGTSFLYSNILPCQPGLSENFYIAGMHAQVSYILWSRLVYNGNVTWSKGLTFRAGTIPSGFPTANIFTPSGSATSVKENIVLQSYITLAPNHGFGKTGFPPTAYNLSGDVLWYYPTAHANQTYLARPAHGGTFLLYLYENPTDQTVLREVDLQGNVVRQTNTYVISQQLTLMHRPPINWLSHEALRLANGHTLVLGMTERILTNVQGPGPVDVLGDMIIDLDQNFQVTWIWDTFDHLPNDRMAVLGETCTSNLAPCGPLFLAASANDWTHCNSILIESDGNLVLSIRNQDWVVKINYLNGTGDGDILWTLGNLAEQAGTPYFTLKDASGPWPWFSHQHDVQFDGTNYELLDNGNTRVSPAPLGLGSGDSRGQVYHLNESSMSAVRLVSADLGGYSHAYGSAQLLSNGDYWFSLGDVATATKPLNNGQELATSDPLSFSYSVTFPDSTTYRTFRLSSFYNYTN